MSAIILRCSLGDLPVLSGDAVEHLRGNWRATVTTHLPDGAAALAELSVAELRFAREDGTVDAFVGVVRRSAVAAGTAVIVSTIVGGAGKLIDDVLPRDHAPGAAPTPAGLIARAICDDAGEVLADGIEDALDAYPVRRWTRTGGPASGALDLLADVIGLGWRVLRSGRVWLGIETWPTLEATKRLSPIPDDGSETWATDGAPIMPGVTVNGRRVLEVRYEFNGTTSRAFVRSAVAGDPPRVPDLTLYERTWSGSVVSQASDGTIEVLLDDARIGTRARALRGVPLRCGIPGAKVTLQSASGERVRLAFEGADPRGVYALPAFDQTTGTVHGVARSGDSCGFLLVTCSAPGSPAVVTVSPTATGAPGEVEIVIVGGSEEVQIR